MPAENTITATKLPVVEGSHEKDFFKAMWRNLGLTGFQVLPIGGKEGLRLSLASLKNQSAFPQVTSVVIVRDADDNHAGAFQSVCAALASNGLPVPQ